MICHHLKLSYLIHYTRFSLTFTFCGRFYWTLIFEGIFEFGFVIRKIRLMVCHHLKWWLYVHGQIQIQKFLQKLVRNGQKKVTPFIVMPSRIFWRFYRKGWGKSVLSIYHLWCGPDYYLYRGSPTYVKITNTVPYFRSFGLCTCKWAIFGLVGDLLQSH